VLIYDVISGRCICSNNYTGSDCSLPVSRVPADVSLFARGLCRVRSSNCHVISVTGTGFIDSNRLSCRLQKFAVSIQYTLLSNNVRNML